MSFGHGYGSSSDANAIGFFKILQVGHLQGAEFMIIPSNFERKYKLTLPNPIILRIPTGVEWKVYWTKREYDIWFKQDWKKFALDCSLRGPHFLVFKYEGGPRFEVRIFDESYYDIDYSSIRCTNGASTTNHHDESVEIVHINDDSDVFLESDEMQNQQLPSKKKTNTTKGKCGNGINQSRETKGAPSRREHNKTKIKEDLVAHQKNVSAGARRGTKASPKQNENKNPVFICTMTPTYVTQSKLGIPKYFSNEYLAGYKGNATIGVADEDRSWPIRIGFEHSSNQSYMAKGWKPFCKECKLKVGDVCVFKRTRCKPLSFEVIIRRKREEPEEQGYGYESNPNSKDKLKRSSIQNMGKKRSGNEQVAKRRRISFSCQETDSKNSIVEEKNYKIQIKNYHQDVCPTLGKEFFNKFPTCIGKYLKLQVEGKWWPVRVLYYPSGDKGFLSAGWTTFMRECKLQVNRIWEFNMIDEKNLVFEVSISRQRESAT